MSEIGKHTISEIIDEYAEQMSHIRPGNVDGAKLVLERFAARLQAEWSAPCSQTADYPRESESSPGFGSGDGNWR